MTSDDGSDACNVAKTANLLGMRIWRRATRTTRPVALCRYDAPILLGEFPSDYAQWDVVRVRPQGDATKEKGI